MSRHISNSVVLTVFSILCSSSGYGAEIKLSPISADGSHSINGQTIQLQGGNQRIVLELKLLDWDPDLIGTPLLRAYQAIINSCGYGIEDSICNGGIRDGECCVTDGTCVGGTCENPGVILSPAVETCTQSLDCSTSIAPGSACKGVCTGGSNDGTVCSVDANCADGGVCVNKFCSPAFVDKTRTDFILFGIVDGIIANVVTTTLDYQFGGLSFVTSVADNGSEFYFGTLVLDVPFLAVGTYTISMLPSAPGVTFMTDPFGTNITPLDTTSVIVDVKCVVDDHCDDGNACTDDICNPDGTCSNNTNYNTATECCNPDTRAIEIIDDGNDCTDDLCNPDGSVDHPFLAEFTSCGSSTSNDCDNPDTCNSTGLCLPRFEPGSTACGNPTVTECDNADTCNGSGDCLPNFVPINIACGDPANTQCDNPDSCDGGGSCRINNVSNGTSCNDGLFCTVSDACLNGTCSNNSARNCSDNKSCTTDSCNETNNQCDHLLNAGFCMITNTCISEGTIDPSNDCSECNTNLSTTDWVSRSAGSLCDDGIFCTINDACDGAGFCISDFSPDGTFCASDGNECTQNICLAGGCAHPFEDAGISCGSQTETECNHANTCNGAGVCLDNFEDSGIPCGDPTVTQCDLADICNGVGGCVDNAVAEGTTCDDENPLTAEDACDGAGICEGVLIPEASIVEGIGPRALLVTPLPVNSPVPVALNITSPDWPCLDKFVNLDGTLTTTPVSQTPAQWGTINVHDPDIVPDTTYSISAVIGEIVAPPGFGKTAIWGDVDLNEMANIGDVLLTVDGWLGSIRVPQEAMDLLPCIQDERINLRDILAAVGAWLGSSYESRCSLPCP